MIPKANVKVIGLKRGASGKVFVVAGYETLGYYPAWQKRTYKTYDQARRYSLQLRDYYNAEIVEF